MIRLKSAVLIGICVFGASSGVAFGQAPKWSDEREINQLTEHVYRFGLRHPRYGMHNGMFVVTPEGIIVMDGICENMEWLKSELQSRFNVPVKYVVLSHDHQSHICDTQVFADTAVGVGHVKIKPHIVREGRRAIVPQVMFEDSMELELGGIQVKLLYLGPTHSDNMIYMHVPSEGVLFAPDFARGRNMLPDFRDLEVHNALQALRMLAYMPDVTMVLDGHSSSTTTQDAFLVFRRYLQAMNDRVLERVVKDMSLIQIRREVTMEDFKDYNQSPQVVITQVETMFDYLWRYRDTQVTRAPR